LTHREFWNSKYKYYNIQDVPSESSFLKTLIKKMLGKRLMNYMNNYSSYFLWDVIYNKYLLKRKGAKILEVGSAPGENLIKFYTDFGFEPYGIEYSEDGADLNKRLFILNNLNPENVIHSDFFSEEFQKKYAGSFDIVFSGGFIEHFTDVKDVIDKHLNLLAKGGCLIISIPNFKGINYILLRIFYREMISQHNIDIMGIAQFTKLFDNNNLIPLFCGYFGIFDFGLFGTKQNSPLRFVLSFCKKCQLILNIIFRILFKNIGLQNRYFGPYLMYVGIKNA